MDSAELKITEALAQLELSESEREDARRAFEEMLEYFSAMRDADAVLSLADGESVADARRWSAPPAFFRADAADGGRAPEIDPERIIEKSAEHDGRFIVIPNVL
jgi:Asp-tRNA(Asn)/Glu-tRNA(Gln) amidotransferase C subunit